MIFLKDTPNVMYVGPELSEADKAMLTAIGASMVFVQDVLAKLSKEVMEYNFPGVVLPEGFSVESINAQILSELEFGTDSSHYILVHFENGQFSMSLLLLNIRRQTDLSSVLVFKRNKLLNGVQLQSIAS